jgi:hypothetical protein
MRGAGTQFGYRRDEVLRDAWRVTTYPSGALLLALAHATNVAERDHLVRQAARARAALAG